MKKNKNELFNEFQKEYVHYLNILHSFLVEEGIIYTLSGTTLLGAAQESGFLVNEDSIHLSLLYSDYKKLISIKDKLPESYKMVPSAPGKTVDAYSTMLTIEVVNKRYNFDNKNLIRFFIHPILGYESNAEEAKKYEKLLKRNEIKTMVKSKQPRNNICNIFIWIFWFIFAPSLASLQKERNEMIFDKFDYDKTGVCILYYNNKRYAQKQFKKAVFEEPNYIVFDECFFFAPKNPELILELLYSKKVIKSKEEKTNLSTMNYLANTNFFFSKTDNKIEGEDGSNSKKTAPRMNEENHQPLAKKPAPKPSKKVGNKSSNSKK